MVGTIRTIHHDKAYGFISTPAEGDYFFHRSSVQPQEQFGELVIGTKVEFEPQARSPKGPRAENVRIVENAE